MTTHLPSYFSVWQVYPAQFFVWIISVLYEQVQYCAKELQTKFAEISEVTRISAIKLRTFASDEKVAKFRCFYCSNVGEISQARSLIKTKFRVIRTKFRFDEEKFRFVAKFRRIFPRTKSEKHRISFAFLLHNTIRTGGVTKFWGKNFGKLFICFNIKSFTSRSLSLPVSFRHKLSAVTKQFFFSVREDANLNVHFAWLRSEEPLISS